METDFLESADFTIETYATGELCMENLSHNPDVIILDYPLEGIDKDAMNGIDTLDKIKAFNPDIPVVKLSSQDKIDVAINCMVVPVSGTIHASIREYRCAIRQWFNRRRTPHDHAEYNHKTQP